MKTYLLAVAVAFLPLSALAKTAELGGRVALTYDEAAWQSLRPRMPGGDGLTIHNDVGDFSVVVVPEEKISGGISTPETRASFVQGLGKMDVKTADVKSVREFGHEAFEFVGTRTLNKIVIRVRIVLLTREKDAIFVVASAIDEDPLLRPQSAADWKSVIIR